MSYRKISGHNRVFLESVTFQLHARILSSDVAQTLQIIDIFRTLEAGSLSVTAMGFFSSKANTSIHGLGEDDTASTIYVGYFRQMPSECWASVHDWTRPSIEPALFLILGYPGQLPQVQEKTDSQYGYQSFSTLCSRTSFEVGGWGGGERGTYITRHLANETYPWFTS